MNINKKSRETSGKYILKAFFVIASVTVLSSCQSAEELKTEQYFVEGYQLYKANCANCHQAEGKGMANLYPPLIGASSLKDKALFSCIIKNGLKDTIQVAGKSFSRPMPANPKLTDLEIAEIITYVSMKWDEDSTYTTIETVHKGLLSCEPK